MIRLSFDFQSKIFNHRVAQKFAACFVQLASRGFPVSAVQFDLQIFAHVHRVDAVVAHLSEGVLDSFSLRIDHGFFRGDDDFGLHVKAGQPRETFATMLLKEANER